ncbi:gamma-glutamylcyclotransferase family protein [Marinobacterium litorale]|uniref:gamma-glutamylcyclotransferase family protein n=1 Tax=Marinobacterium litorale TaxID=404770 RepID=UPI001FE150C9|nr:gamma-glutamylcyclotransferase family protein [Marinobacterium litorale]
MMTKLLSPSVLAITATFTLVLPLFYLWFTLLSPWGYTRPAHLLDVEPGEHQVFVYGTLRSPIVRRLVIGEWVESEPARLSGYRKTGLDLEPDQGRSVEGETFTVSRPELLRLDRYERLGIRYERVSIELTDGSQAWVYQRLERP